MEGAPPRPSSSLPGLTVSQGNGLKSRYPEPPVHQALCWPGVYTGHMNERRYGLCPMELQQEALACPEAGNVDRNLPPFCFQSRERLWYPGFSFPKAGSFRQTRWRGRACQPSWLKTCVRWGHVCVHSWTWPALHFLKSLNSVPLLCCQSHSIKASELQENQENQAGARG